MTANTLRNAPFLRAGSSNDRICAEILIALSPVAAWGTVVYGFRALLLLLCGAAAAAAVRLLWNLIARQRIPEELVSSALTGMLSALCLSSAAPCYLALICGAAASAVRLLCRKVRVLHVHPVCFAALLASFWKIQIPKAFTRLPVTGLTAEEIGKAAAETPLDSLTQKILPETTVLDLMLGNCAGTVGELSAVLLLIGFGYLVFRKILHWQGTVQMLLSAAVVALIFPVTLDTFGSMACELFSGALVLGAVYLANDPDACPKTDTARTAYFIGCGALSVLFRYAFSFADGVFPAILLMGLLSGILDRLLAPRLFGRGKGVKRDLSGDNIDQILADLPANQNTLSEHKNE